MAKRSYKDAEAAGEREIVYVVCPLCGRNRVLEVRSETAKVKGKGRLRWDFFGDGSPLVHIREAGGKLPKEQQVEGLKKVGGARAYGFPLKQALTWEEAQQSQEFNDQIEAIRRQISKLYDLLVTPEARRG